MYYILTCYNAAAAQEYEVLKKHQALHIAHIFHIVYSAMV
jgi:hypothetical protein